MEKLQCLACGNRTRFTATVTTTVRSFYHFTLGGELNVEDSETLNETVDSVTCRWCGHGRDVVPLTDAE